MKRIIFAIIILTCLFSCRHKYYTALTIPYNDADFVDSINLDGNWDFYTRKVYKDSGTTGKSFSADAAVNRRTQRSNEGLIEMEHLFISNKSKLALLITLAPDVQEKYYNTTALDNKYINIYDFSTFHFGKIIDTANTTLQFYTPDYQAVDIWEMDCRNQIATIQRIIEYDSISNYGIEFNQLLPVNETFKDPLNFEKVENVNLVFKKTVKTKYRKRHVSSTSLPELANNRIFLVKRKNKYFVYFKFETAIANNHTCVYFKKRVRHLSTTKPHINN